MPRRGPPLEESLILEFSTKGKIDHVEEIVDIIDLLEWIDKNQKARKAITSLVTDTVNRNRASVTVNGETCVCYVKSFYLTLEGKADLLCQMTQPPST